MLSKINGLLFFAFIVIFMWCIAYYTNFYALEEPHNYRFDYEVAILAFKVSIAGFGSTVLSFILSLMISKLIVSRKEY